MMGSVDAETQTYTSLSEDAHYMVQKAVEKGNDIFYVSNNLNTKETTYFGTDLGKKFLDDKRELLLEFYKFCVETYSAEEGVSISLTEELPEAFHENNDAEAEMGVTGESEKMQDYEVVTPARKTRGMKREVIDEDRPKIGVPCSVCHKIFKNDEYLKQHMQIHEKINYHCPECDRPFSVKRYIYNHMRTSHGKEYHAKTEIRTTPYVASQCPECKEVYPSQEVLMQHRLESHSEETDETVKMFKSEKARNWSTKSVCNKKGSFECSECGEKFQTKLEMEKHDLTHMPAPFTCPVCDEGFTVRRRIATHMKKVHNMTYTDENDVGSESASNSTPSTPATKSSDGVITTRSGRKSKKTSKMLEKIEDVKSTVKIKAEVSTPKQRKTSVKQEKKTKEEVQDETVNKENHATQVDTEILENNTEKDTEEKSKDEEENKDVGESKDGENEGENVGNEKEDGEIVIEGKNENEVDEDSLDMEDDDDDEDPDGVLASMMDSEDEYKPSIDTPKMTGSAKKRRLDDSSSSGSSSKVRFGKRPRFATKKKEAISLIPQQRNANAILLEGRMEEVVINNKIFFKCLVCSKVVKQRTAIIKHMKSHDEMIAGKYQCHICDVRFTTNYKLGNHLRDIHKQLNAFQCEKCKIKFSGRKAYIEHEAICTVDPNEVVHDPNDQEIDLKCIFCKAECENKETLDAHELEHRDETGVFKCPDPQCDLTFLEKGFCKLHFLTIHSPEENTKKETNVNPLQCRLCLKVLNTQATYEVHMKIHDDESLVCKICNKRFNYPYTLRNHNMLHHSDEPAFQCPHCEQKFKLKRYMSKHIAEKHIAKTKPANDNLCKICEEPIENKMMMLEHMKSKHEQVIIAHRKIFDDEKEQKERYGCSRCHKEYLTVDDFILHVSNHRPKRKLVCDHCGNSFNTKSNLNTHVRLKHSTLRPFECELCSKKFALRTLLNQHIRFYHQNERPAICHICGRGFKTKSQLSKHSYTHRENTIDCEACEHKSWTMEGYKIHMVANHPELAAEKKIHHYTCQYCSRRFAVLHQYKRHLAVHTGLKPHKCGQCDYACSSMGTLNSHVKRVHNPQSRIFQCNFCFMTFSEAGKMYRHMDTTKHIENCRRNGVDPHTIREDVSYLIKSRENTISRRGYNMGQTMKKIRPTEVQVENVEMGDIVIEDAGEFVEGEELKIEVPVAAEEEVLEEVQEEEVQEGEQQIEINSEVLRQILQGAALSQGQDSLPQNIEINTQVDEDGTQCFVIQLPENSEFTVVDS